MSRMFTALGASIVALAAMASSVEAKTVFYEINGERYSYDTSNRQQAAAARQQIEAAKTVEAARAKAAAERASNPLVAIFGSQAQREAAEAQAQLERILADQQRAAAARKGQRPLPIAKDEGATKSAEQKPGETAGAIQREPTTVAAIAAAQPPRLQSAPDLRGAGEPAQSNGALRAAIKSISLDAETSIKTIFRVDGSIHEELFDLSVLSKLDSDQCSAPAVSAVPGVAQPDKGTLDDTTGPTSLPRTMLGLNAGADTPGRFPAN
jgi:NADH dehydrogenase/NADH:ubiquinone oxidoreductase subunit G